MNADAWARTRRDFERLRALEPAQRESWLRRAEARDAAGARELRELLAADVADDALLDTDGPTLHAAWSTAGASADTAPREIAGWRIIGVLGEGGSAIVYRGAGDGTAAIKVLKPEACSPGLARRFEQEAETLIGLEHPGLIRVFGAGHLDDGRPYLVTEYVDGEPLDAFCERRELGLAARLRLFVEVCRAVHHAHAHLIVHRDLKPSNILVDGDARPKVLDFGIAKLLDPARDPRWTDLYGRGPLTLSYASPEQVRGESLTTASDVYSLGVLLHVLVTGGSPYAESPAEREALERAVAAARRRAPDAAARASGRMPPPRDVVAIVERALALRTVDRYASAEHLAEDVTCFLEGRPLRSRSEPWTRRFARFARRRPWLVAAGVAAVLVSIGSWIGTERSLRRVMASESVAWRAHANAVHSTNLLAELLERIGANAVASADLARLVAETEGSLEELGDQPEAEARLRMALARLENARGALDSAEAHLVRALALSRDTRGLSWRDSEQCLARIAELRARRDDPRALEPARERVELLNAQGEDAAEARATLDALHARFAAR
ncbi:MAG: serine/threonine protein kinase [Planctomycetes bacterium]|nr:serine/threonine protein kinase [Planctomycetota bacterium]